MRSILNGAIGRKLRPIECHDLICHEADAVLSGGIRRAACLAMFDYDDMEMLTAKVVLGGNLTRSEGEQTIVLYCIEHITREQFDFIWQRVIDSGCGEPGVVWTNNYGGALIRKMCADLKPSLIDLESCSTATGAKGKARLRD